MAENYKGDVQFGSMTLLVGGWPCLHCSRGAGCQDSATINGPLLVAGVNVIGAIKLCRKRSETGGKGTKRRESTRPEDEGPRQPGRKRLLWWLVPYDTIAAAIVGERGRLRRRWRPDYVFNGRREHLQRQSARAATEKSSKANRTGVRAALTQLPALHTMGTVIPGTTDGATRRHHQARHGAAQRT